MNAPAYRQQTRRLATHDAGAARLPLRQRAACPHHRYVTFSAEGLEPFLGASLAVDFRLTGIANEVIVDVIVQAVSLTAFRIFRWWDAQQYE